MKERFLSEDMRQQARATDAASLVLKFPINPNPKCQLPTTSFILNTHRNVLTFEVFL